MEFELEGQEYIELIKLLKFMNLVGSGGEAKMVVDQGEVVVNGENESRKRRKLIKGDIVEFAGETIEII
ncbi:MAG: RNA-binding S4 domain-containing protein [Bacteroidales bacterium]|nr:RNA-binding S4 domain-containing protein [Bacteroidales bacterium]